MKHIVLQYKEKSDSDSRIQDLYDSLKTGSEELNTGLLLQLQKERFHNRIYVKVPSEGGFTIRYVNGEYQIGTQHTCTGLAEAYRICSNLIGSIIYGSENRDYH